MKNRERQRANRRKYKAGGQARTTASATTAYTSNAKVFGDNPCITPDGFCITGQHLRILNMQRPAAHN